MRLVIDLQSCQSGSRLGGIGRYSSELAKAMARNTRGHELWLMLSSILPAPIAQVRSEFSDLIPQDQIVVFNSPSKIAELSGNKAKVRSAEMIREAFLADLQPDMVHVSSLFEGLQEDVVTSVGNIYPAQRTAVTLYDLIPLVQRKQYLSNADALAHYLGKIENLKKSELLLSISDFSRIEAIDLLGIRPDRVVNISSAADKRFQPLEVSADDAHSLREKYSISRKFLMYTGSFDQRKNHANLISAFGKVPSHVRKDYQLVIVGNGWDAIYSELRGVAQRAGLEDDEVIFAGHVSDADLLPLYNLCYLFVFPSLAEGFGLPVLEAMSCGIPTIGSNCTSIPEVIGWADAMFDPKSVESIAEKIHQGLANGDFRTQLRARGIEQAKKFSWDESARRAIDAFEARVDVLGAKSRSFSAVTRFRPDTNAEDHVVEALTNVEGIEDLPDGALLEMSQSISLNRFGIQALDASFATTNPAKIGWVTSWNTRCGIASYSSFLVEDFFDKVKIFAADTTDQVQADEDNVIRCWQAGVADPLDRLTSAIDKTDVDAIVIQFNYGFFDFTMLSRFIENQVNAGRRVFVALHSTRDPSEVKRLILLSDAFVLCDGVLVHTMNDVAVLSKIGVKSNVHLLPQGVIDRKPAPIDAVSFKGLRVIGTYGFALPSKGLLEVLEAFADLRAKGLSDLHLLMVNAEYPAFVSTDLIAQIRARVDALGLAAHVTMVTDYLSDAESLGYLQHADIVVYGYQDTGESSSAAVRMGLASRRPVAVTPSEIFTDVRASVFVLPGHTPEDIATGLRKLLDLDMANDKAASTVLRAAQAWVRAHEYGSIARHLFWLVSKPRAQHIDYYLPPSFKLKAGSNEFRFKAGLLPLKTSVGAASGTSIKTTNRSGHLLFGPWFSVAPGKYRAQIFGEVGNGGVGPANFEIVIAGGSKMLAKSDMNSKDGMVGDVLFEVPEEGCTDLEVRVWVGEHSDILVSELALKPYVDPKVIEIEYMSIEN